MTFLLFYLMLVCFAFGQAVCQVDKKTKELTVPPGIKTDYRVFGYQFTSAQTRKMICFSSHDGDVHANYNQCPLGSYFDTNRMNPEDKITYLGTVGGFGKMVYIAANGKRTIFYIAKSDFSIH
jgi:hypothetical protein